MAICATCPPDAYKILQMPHHPGSALHPPLHPPGGVHEGSSITSTADTPGHHRDDQPPSVGGIPSTCGRLEGKEHGSCNFDEESREETFLQYALCFNIGHTSSKRVIIGQCLAMA